MKALLGFVVKEWRHILRDRQTLLILLLLPLAQVVLFGYALRTDVRDVRLVVIAYNRGEISVDRALRRGADPENGYGKRILGPRAHGGQEYKGTGIRPLPSGATTTDEYSDDDVDDP